MPGPSEGDAEQKMFEMDAGACHYGLTYTNPGLTVGGLLVAAQWEYKVTEASHDLNKVNDLMAQYAMAF